MSDFRWALIFDHLTSLPTRITRDIRSHASQRKLWSVYTLCVSLFLCRDQSSEAQHKQQLAPPHVPGAAHEAAVNPAELDLELLDASSDDDSDSDLDSDELQTGVVLKRARKFMGKRARKFMGKRARKFMGKRARKFMGWAGGSSWSCHIILMLFETLAYHSWFYDFYWLNGNNESHDFYVLVSMYG